MKTWKKVVLGTAAGGAGLLVAAIALVCVIAPRSAPTRGARISPDPAGQTALLIVDLQEDYTGPQARQPYPDSERLIATGNQLIAAAQGQGQPVIFIQNVFANPILQRLVGGINAPGAPGTAMDRRLLRVPGLQTFQKHNGDAFSNPELEACLRAHRVTRLVIAGLDGAMCVNATARGALNRGYQVTLVRQGIATRGRRSVEELAQGWRQAGATVL